MLNFIYTYGLFLAEAATIVIAILLAVSGIGAVIMKNKDSDKEKIEIKKLNDKYTDLRTELNAVILNKHELKQLRKKEKIKHKIERKANKSAKHPPKKRIFIVNFLGDIKASAVSNLREEITAILTIATPTDEVLVKIESSGGVVHGYGLAASQLKRIREHNIPLVACVDKVAASGGYMMACVADRILAAPFAILGSIGVIAQLPNFHRLLKKHNIDFEQIMAGEYKRTLSLFGENTNKGRRKIQEEIEDAHELFKDFVAENRPLVDINAIATGEHWYGVRAKEHRLIDEIITSDDYLLAAKDKADLYEIAYTYKKNWLEKFYLPVQKSLSKLWLT